MIIRNDSDRALHIVYQGEDITIPPDGEVSCEEQHPDSVLLDKLERVMGQVSGNGVALMRLNNGSLVSIDDLGDEDGSDLGAELACATDLRSAIEE